MHAPLFAQQPVQPPPAPLQPPAARAPVLTLAECVRMALAQGFDLDIERQSLSIAQDDIPIARSLFHPIIAATGGKSYSRTAAEDGIPGTRSETVDAGIGVSQRMYLSTQIGLDLRKNRFDSDPALTALNPAYTADATLSIPQP